MITFEYADTTNGFFVKFRIPFSHRNLASVLRMRQTRNIRWTE